MKAKKLIEVAMPIKEISAESVRDKSIRHGHISTLHLWWARRPLPTCRAVVFASLVPDPLDENCPQVFKDAVYNLLHGEGIEKTLYAPYSDIPYTSVHDQMEDNLRNRLLMFIGKFSNKCQENMLAGKTTSPKDQLIDKCLIKWESKNDEWVLGKARKLIWVAYNSERFPEKSYIQLSESFDLSYNAIRLAEDALYSTKNRHQRTPEILDLEEALRVAIENFQNNMPSVFDPFAGGGAIPLEAARLGCRSFGNDINPVAHIIEKGSVEFPQKYGKPITYSREEFERIYGDDGWKLISEKGIPQINSKIVEIPNRLSFDVEYYAKILINKTKEKTNGCYFVDSEGKSPAVYYWLRFAKCNNASCGFNIPLFKQYILSKPRVNKLKSRIKHFAYSVGNNYAEIHLRTGESNQNPLVVRGNVTCPKCGGVIKVEELKEQFRNKETSERIISLIYEENGKTFISAEFDNDYCYKNTPSVERPKEKLQPNSAGGDVLGWGFTKWGDLFNNRQLYVIDSFCNSFHEIRNTLTNDDYSYSILNYLAILIDRIAIRMTSLGKWHYLQDTVEHLYGKQAMQMNYDYPELDPFSKMSSSAIGQLNSITSYIEEESYSTFASTIENRASGNIMQFAKKSLSSVVTDPPYYDAIAYADISDFFYVWLKRTLGPLYPNLFSTPQTPKAEECTALKHHHGNSEVLANQHFEDTLLEIFKVIEQQTDGIISIMFAHQSTQAWTTLCNSILGANMNIMSGWAMDTEVSAALKTNKDTLESSVTVACLPSERKGFVGYKAIKEGIGYKVSEEVRTLYNLGFRGADLLTACFGKAVSEFGNYETVEKADGSEVSVAELLELARTSAFTALLRDFTGDDYTKFYIGWLQLNGMGDTDFDDATKFTRVGMNVNIGDIQRALLLIKDEDSRKQHLASYKERGGLSLRNMSEDKPLIDKVHLAMKLWGSGERNYLLPFIAQYGNDINNEFWRVLVVLKELLPATSEDFVQANGLLQNADNLIKDSKNYHGIVEDGPSLFDNLD